MSDQDKDEGPLQTRFELESRLIARAWQDEAFRKELLANPRAESLFGRALAGQPITASFMDYALPRADLTVTAAPSQHFSGRGLRTRNSTLWSSMVLRSRRHSVFFSGDTGLTTEYATIRERLGPFDLVMLEVGAFHPAWGHIHLGPENALEAWKLLKFA